MLILSPPNGFLSRSLFHNPPHSCGKRACYDCSHDFMRQTGFAPFGVTSWKRVTYGFMQQGDGEGGKRGTGGENPEGEGGLQPGCPPFPGLSPQASGKPVLRVPSTQSIKDKPQAGGHKDQTHPPTTHYKNKRSYILCIITKKQVKRLACAMVKNESNILTLPHVYGKVKIS